MAFALSAFALPSAAQAEWQRGVNYTDWDATGYGTPASDASLQRVASDGNSHVELTPTWYMSNLTSSTIAPASWSPTDASVLHAMQQARSLGLQVVLKPHIDVLTGQWRATIAPADPAAWWSSYDNMILHYAQLAQQAHASMFVVGTELKSMTVGTYTSQWQSLISSVRSTFSGKLTYAANFNEYWNVKFWSSLDYIGVDNYLSLTNLLDPAVASLVSAWNTSGDVYWFGQAAAYFHKPILFTEIGYCTTPDNTISPAVCDSSTVDQQAQQNAYEAAYEVFSKQSWMAGMYWWNWPARLPANGWNTDFPPVFKPAESTMKSWNQLLANH